MTSLTPQSCIPVTIKQSNHVDYGLSNQLLTVRFRIRACELDCHLYNLLRYLILVRQIGPILPKTLPIHPPPPVYFFFSNPIQL